jgi:hypothetical protein
MRVPPPIVAAQELDALVRAAARARNVAIADLVFRLREMGDTRLYEWLGHPSLAAYAFDVAGYSGSTTRELVAMAKRLDALPEIRAAFEAGKLEWTKARTASAAAARDGNEELWLRLAKMLTSRQLEREAASRSQEDGPAVERLTLTLEMTGEERAAFEDGLNLARKAADRPLTTAQAILWLFERALSGGGVVGGPTTRVVIDLCGRCKQATRETADGPVEVAPDSIEAALCDAEVLDIRSGPAPVEKTMPKKTADFIDARDRRRCCFPRCRNRVWVDRHHEGGRRVVGHDPAACLLLCTQHHAMRHRGLFAIEGQAPDWVFRLADGTVVEAPSIEDALTRAARETGPDGAARETGPDGASRVAESEPVEGRRSPSTGSRGRGEPDRPLRRRTPRSDPKARRT